MASHPTSPVHRRAYILYGLIAAVLLLAGCSRKITVVRAQLVQPPPKEAVEDATPDQIRDGLILFRQGEYGQARAAFEQALMADSSNWQAYYFLALIARRQENPGLALALFQRSLHFAPLDARSRAQIYVAIAETHELQGNYGEAELNYRTALHLFPESNTAKEALDRLAQRAASANR